MLTGAAFLTATPQAHAQPAPADVLFYQGKALMDQGQTAKACQKFAESLSLVRRGGTLLNLAICREKEGLYATAFHLLEEARDVAAKEGRADRAALAITRIEAVRPKLSWLTVRLLPGASATPIVIQRDGEILPSARVGISEAIDPGVHIVVAAAPGFPRFEAKVRVATEGGKQVVEIPSVTGPTVASSPSEPVILGPTAPSSPGSPQREWMRLLGFSALGLGTGALAVGSVSGIKALLDSKESERLCPNNRCPASTGGYEKNRDARTEAVVADVALPVGLAAAAAGVSLLLLSRATPAGRPRATTGLVIAPMAEGRRTGVLLGGVW